MSKLIGYFKVTDLEAIELVRKMLKEREERNSLGAEMTFFGVETTCDKNLSNGKAVEVEDYKMSWEVDYQYFLDANPPYIMVRKKCYRDECDNSFRFCDRCKKRE